MVKIDGKFIHCYLRKPKKRPKIIGIMIIKNEALILQDSLDAMGEIVDSIVVLDDASTDNSVQVCIKHPKVTDIIVNTVWESGVEGQRYIQESIHRQKVLEVGRKYNPKWFLYMDADERVDGDIREYMLNNIENKAVRGIRLSLFDAYMTPKDKLPYIGGKLFDFRSWYGQERRDILMAWKNNKNVYFDTSHMSRTPTGVDEDKIVNRFFVQHYGKSLSVEHWESTCDFYIEFFPVFSDKWKARKGKAIHTKSDFGTDLKSWEYIKKSRGIELND